MLDYIMKVLKGREDIKGSVPWPEIRKTIPTAMRTRTKLKRGDKK